MIRGVRKSFIRITMTMLTLVLIIPLAAINIVTAFLTHNSNKQLLEQIAQTEIYILSPQNNDSDVPPNDKQFMGIEKQQHTTSISSDVTTASLSSSTSSSTTTVTVKSSYKNSENNYVSPVKPHTNIQTTVPQPSGVPSGSNDDTRTEPYFSGTDNSYTRPPEPVLPEQPGNHDFWRQNDYYYNDYSFQNFGAVMLYPSALKSMALNLSESSYKSAAASTATVTATATAATTTTTTTTTKAEISENSAASIKSGISSTDAPNEDNFPEYEHTGNSIEKKQLNKDLLSSNKPDMSSYDSIDHFIVYLDKEGSVTDVSGTNDYDIQSCAEIVENLDSSEKDGYYNSLQYVRKSYPEGSIIVFSDRQSDIKMMKVIFFISIGIFVLMEVIVFILTKILTKRAMRPMQISYEKQQQFISDAGHELKTPLTIISANADILYDEIGENKWLSYIKSQTERMRILVQEMLDLTKFTYSDNNVIKSRFNISSLVENAALPFECQAFEQKKTFHIEIEPDIEFFGNTERIRRMVGIFIDNAFKYSNENGTIKIIMKIENNKKILKFYNTGIGIEKGEEDKIFERFYRSDSSRSSQGGYGLGLAIAKSIADQHNIKIQVQSEPGQWISFNLTL